VPVASACARFAREVEGATDERPAAGADGTDGDCRSDVRLANARRTDEQDPTVGVDEAGTDQRDEPGLRNLGIEGPVAE